MPIDKATTDQTSRRAISPEARRVVGLARAPRQASADNRWARTLRALNADAAEITEVADPCGATLLYAQRFSHARISSVIKDLLSSPTALREIARRSYAHDNGFAKVVLLEKGYKLRLHYRPATAARGAENIHDHRWDFLSSVLFGKLVVEKFEQCAAKATGAFTVPDCVYIARENGSSEYGIRPVGLAHLKQVSADVYAANSAYYLNAAVLHRIVTVQGGSYATLVFTHRPFASTTRLMPGKKYALTQSVQTMSVARLTGVLQQVAEQL